MSAVAWLFVVLACLGVGSCQRIDASDLARTDTEVVALAIAPLAVNDENIKSFLRQNSATLPGESDDLIQRAACVARLRMGDGKLSRDDVKQYLQNREQSTDGNQNELLSRACDYLAAEVLACREAGALYKALTVEVLKAHLARLGPVSTAGSKSDLTYRLGRALLDLSAIRTHLDQPAGNATDGIPTTGFQARDAGAVLRAAGLESGGSVDAQLARLAKFLGVERREEEAHPGSPHCDMVVDSGLCVAGGRKVLAPPATPIGLVGRWTFDDERMLDSAGSLAHPVRPVVSGPGMGGSGRSARFDGDKTLIIPHHPDFDSPSFCVTLWLYLLEDSTGEWRTILRKGEGDDDRYPMLALEPTTRGVEMIVASDSGPPARVWSNTFLPLRRWTHIAACVDSRIGLRLFVNGILDAENAVGSSGGLRGNAGALYVGGDGPNVRETSGRMKGFVDELRWYARVLTDDEIQAEAAAALGIVEPSFVELGCMGCSLSQCAVTCRQGYQVCTRLGLASGGRHVARSMGWATSNTHRIWAAEDAPKGSLDALSGNVEDSSLLPEPGVNSLGAVVGTGLCMCCRE